MLVFAHTTNDLLYISSKEETFSFENSTPKCNIQCPRANKKSSSITIVKINTLPAIGRVTDLHRLENVRAGRTEKKAPAISCKCLNHKGLFRPFQWSHLGLNQGPPDYESGATNQLSYGTVPLCITKTVIFNWSANIVIFFNPICFSAKNYFHFAVIASVNRKPHEQERRRA